MAEGGFDRERIPARMWMTAQAVVEVSLAALGSGQVLVVPGEDNRAMARFGLQQQSDSLQ